MDIAEAINALPHRVIFLGYRVKMPWRPEGPWWSGHGGPNVQEVCSVSDCMATPPQDWVERWDFNRAGCYATPSDAEATIPHGEQERYAMFAYWLVLPDGAEVAPFLADLFSPDLDPLPTAQGPMTYDGLGFDVVGIPPGGMGFECSPLSCNGLAKEELVNTSCLLDSGERALALAADFNASDAPPEPGSYYAILVARDPNRSRFGEARG